jgi:protein-disulfide isomerase
MHTMRRNKIFFIIIFAVTHFFITNAFGDILAIGNKKAEVTVKVFSSLTCPHCASFHQKVFKSLKKDYIDKDKVRFEHHAFPLDLAALNAEKIVRCATNAETRFELLHKIYDEQKKWAVGSDINKINAMLIKIALEFQIKENNLKNCLLNENSQEIILKERIDAQKEYNITGTPTIYINGKKYEDKHEFKSFKRQIDKLL